MRQIVLSVLVVLVVSSFLLPEVPFAQAALQEILRFGIPINEHFSYKVDAGDEFAGDGCDDIAVSAPTNEMGPVWDHSGHVFIYGGNPGMVDNDDPLTPSVKEQLQLRISPNPIRREDQMLSISFKNGVAQNRQPVSIEIYNVRGQSVCKEEYTVQGKDNELQMNLSSLQSGVYLCKFTHGTQSAITKFSIIK